MNGVFENKLMSAVNAMFFTANSHSTPSSSPPPPLPSSQQKAKQKRRQEEEDADEEVVESKEYRLRDRASLRPPQHPHHSVLDSIVQKYGQQEAVKQKVIRKPRKPYKPIPIPKFAKANLSQLELDQRKQRVGFTYYPKFKCYMFNGKHRMSGSINCTSKWYYSTFDLELCKKPRSKGGKGMRKVADSSSSSAAPADSSSSTAAAAATPPPAGHKSRGQNIEAAQELGKRVDHELKFWTITKTVPPKAHALTKHLIKFFGMQKWKPHMSQQIVGIPNCRVATQYDLLMKNAANELIIVEVKTGGDTYFDESGDQKLDKPLENVESSRKTHALLEALFAKICYNTMYPGSKPVTKVYVVRASGTQIHLYEPSDWIVKAEEDMRKRMAARCKPLPTE